MSAVVLNAARPAVAPVRPVQFLGSKLRSAAQIMGAISEAYPDAGTVADVFTGSTVVAQTAADAGYKVFASDALVSAATFARALLGVDREGSRWSPDVLVSKVLDHCQSGAEQPWRKSLEIEDRALNNRDGQALIEQARLLPQVWRPAGVTTAMSAQFSAIAARESRSATTVGSLAATHYAGTYLGIRQALDVDRIRCAVQTCYDDDLISDWERAVLLTALLSAMSSCAFSAGKHFAQPHQLREDKDLGFASVRIVEDRRLSVVDLFAERLRLVWERGSAMDVGHIAVHTTLEEMIDTPETIAADVLYADPPYTAQQYSRFYHVLEVITEYRVPVLQALNGSVTRGLYPIDRFKSRFCSRRQAPDAFRDLCALARRLKAGLAISYSASTNGQTGNERMISLPGLLQICYDAFGESAVTVRELPHRYRQFNSAANAVDDRDDVEQLIVCRAQ